MRGLSSPCWTVDTVSGDGPTAPTARTLVFAAEGDPARRPMKCQLFHLPQVRYSDDDDDDDKALKQARFSLLVST